MSALGWVVVGFLVVSALVSFVFWCACATGKDGAE